MTTILLGRVCRTCLKNSADMRKLRDFVADDLQIEDMLNQSIPNFSLEMDDIALPVEICVECLDKLQTVYDFVQVCLKSNKELKKILNQREQEIEGSMVAAFFDASPMDILEEKDLLMDNFKKEPDDNNYKSIITSADMVNQTISLEQELDKFKLEVEMKYESHHEDTSSTEEYSPQDDKEDSECNSFDIMTKTCQDYNPKSNSHRNNSQKCVSTKVCLHCNKKFTKRKFLSKHLFEHDPDNKFICDFCDNRFLTARRLKNHIISSHEEVDINSTTSGPYTCPHCSMTYKLILDLAMHRVTHSEKDFECKVCSIDLKTITALTSHMNCKHPDFLPHQCHICQKTFSLEYHINDHINEHMGYQKHKCDICEKSFPNNTALTVHIRKHTGESPFLCPHCGNSFKSSNSLRLHILRHGEKKFHCIECPMKFYAQSKLTEHMSLHTKLKPHVCDICNKAFSRPFTLKSHKFTHTGERPFKCEICNMSFVFKRHWKRHKLTHTGEKPHMCSYCDRAYAASGDLVKHLRTHVGEKTYFCDQCPEAFKYSIDLKDHKSMHYKENLKLQQDNDKTAKVSND